MDKDIEVTLLKEEQIFGKNRLKIFDEYGTNAAITDFAILLGGYVIDNYHYNNSNSLEDRSGYYWINPDDKDNNARVVNYSGNRNYNSYVDSRSGGARPALPYSLIYNISSNGVRGRDGILEVKYGEYPQKVASRILQKKLEGAYKYDQTSIRRTGKIYTTDSRRWDEYGKEFSAQEHEEFEYNGKRYVRVKANSYHGEKEFTLSNGKKYKDGDYVWIEVSPIKWLVDVENDIALSERILFAGIQFDDKDEYDGNFKETFMYKYLNTIFIKDIQVQSKDKDIENIEDKEKDEIDKLFEEIKKFAKYSDNVDELYSYLNGLLDEYNKNIEKSFNNGNLQIESVDSYKNKLILKLELTLDKLKVLYEKRYIYDEIMNLLENYKNILNGIEVNISDELTNDFKKIYEVLNFIENPKLTLEFTNLIENEIEKIKNYLNKSDNVSIEYNDIKTFNLYLRFKIRPLLVRLNSNAVNKDVLMEIKEMIKNEMYKIDKTQKTSVINFYLNLIKEQLKVIRNLDKDNKYNEEIEKIVTMDIDNLKLVTDIICKLYGIEIKLNSEKHIEKSIKKYSIIKRFN